MIITSLEKFINKLEGIGYILAKLMIKNSQGGLNSNEENFINDYYSVDACNVGCWLQW
jgi:hypothetical protein